tara:strand:- start:231 stop:545 length:315 start_codon:yes stop_codon:yes gene_type:complete
MLFYLLKGTVVESRYKLNDKYYKTSSKTLNRLLDVRYIDNFFYNSNNKHFGSSLNTLFNDQGKKSLDMDINDFLCENNNDNLFYNINKNIKNKLSEIAANFHSY